MIKVANNLNVLFEKRSAISDYLNNDYVRYGGGGALAGAGLGALINKLMGGSALKGGLLGAGLGAGAGLGYKGLSDYQAKQRSDKADESMTSVEDIRARGAAERTQRTRDEAAAAKAKKDVEDRAAIARGQRVGNFVPSLPTPQDLQFAFNDQGDLDPMTRLLRAGQLLREREQERMRDAVDPASIERALRGVLNQQPPNLRIVP